MGLTEGLEVEGGHAAVLRAAARGQHSMAALWLFYGWPLGGSTQWLLCIAMQWTAARGQHCMAALWLFYGQPLGGSNEEQHCMAALWGGYRASMGRLWG